MKNLYNTIEQNLKAGLNVVVKDLEDNTYCFILNHKDGVGNYKDSGWRNSIENAKQWIGRCCGSSDDYWDCKDIEIVEVFRPEFEPFKVGDKVRILDSIKKTEYWDDVRDSFPDMTGTIKAVYYERIGTNYRVNGWSIGHEFLTPLVEEEIEELEIEIQKILSPYFIILDGRDDTQENMELIRISKNISRKVYENYISKSEIKEKIDNMIEKHPFKVEPFEISVFKSGKNQGLEDLLKELGL